MKIYQTLEFKKLNKYINISDSSLVNAAEEVLSGLIDARLSEGIYKKRVALPGKGKSGGARTIIIYKSDQFIIFVYGYKKNAKDNITDAERNALLKIRDEFYNLNKNDFKSLINKKKIFLLNGDEDD